MHAPARDAAASGLAAQERRDLAERFIPLARNAAAKFAAFVRADADSADEYESVALLALTRASANFRPELGVLFSLYAGETIRKSLIREASRAGYGGRRTCYTSAPRFEPLPGVDSAAACMTDRRTPAPDARLLAEETMGAWWGGLPERQREAVRLLSFEDAAREDAARKLKTTPKAVLQAVCDARKALRTVA